MQILTPDGVQLHAERRGDPSLPALVLLNGMSQSTAHWRTHMRALADRFCVVAYDGRGQGKSTLGPRPFTLGHHVQDLLAVLDHFALERAHLSGFSHGARVALAAAAAAPERVDRLALTSIGTHDDPLRDLITGSWLELLRLGGLEAMAWATLPQILGRAYLDQHAAHAAAMVKATLQRNTLDGLEALVEGLRGFPPPLEDAPKVRADTLLLTSDEDLLVSPRAARALADAIEGTEHHVIDGVGHTIPIEAPERWRAHITRFLGD